MRGDNRHPQRRPLSLRYHLRLLWPTPMPLPDWTRDDDAGYDPVIEADGVERII